MSFVDSHASPVFEPEGVHKQLYLDRDLYSRLAGIRKDWLWEPLEGRVSENEYKWVSHFRGHSDRGSYGILWTGPPPAQKLPAMVGALTRNFIDARLRTLEELMGDDTGAASASALFIPDFCSGDAPPTPSVRQHVTGVLLRRATNGLQTGLYAVSQSAVQNAYGEAVAALLKESYLKVTQ